MTSLLTAIRPDSQEALRSISNKMADLREELKEREGEETRRGEKESNLSDLLDNKQIKI